MTILQLYTPSPSFITVPSSATAIASSSVLYCPKAGSTYIFFVNFYFFYPKGLSFPGALEADSGPIPAIPEV